MTMKVWNLSINAAADGTLHEQATVNPETATIYVRKIISTRTGNCACGHDSNFWVCLPEATPADSLITSHFNPADGSATMQQFDYATPMEIASGAHAELGIFGSGGSGNMNGGALIFYTLT